MHARHSTLYLVDLPPFLPTSVQEGLVQVFIRKLQEELAIAIGVGDGPLFFRPTHKSKEENCSYESIMSGLPVSTDGSAGCEEATEDNANLNDVVPVRATPRLE